MAPDVTSQAPKCVVLPPVQMLWIGPRLSKLEHTCMQSFLDRGHPVHLYAYGALGNVPRGVSLHPADTILPKHQIFAYQQGPGAGSYSACSNLFRYKLLHTLGGWWVDADVFCLRPLQFSADHVFVRESTGQNLIHSGIIKAPAQSPILAEAVQQATRTDQKTMRWGDTGGRLLTGLARRFPEMYTYAVPADVFCPIPWNGIVSALRFPKIAIPGSSVAVHLFHEMWRRNNLDTEKDWPLITYLKRLAT